jgi:hypothetical protein
MQSESRTARAASDTYILPLRLPRLEIGFGIDWQKIDYDANLSTPDSASRSDTREGHRAAPTTRRTDACCAGAPLISSRRRAEGVRRPQTAVQACSFSKNSGNNSRRISGCQFRVMRW